ncbi:amino acid oxidase [Rhizocola hellebori]|uniref:D-amino-acid oxidase n=1 Tax=Rhizocola hellebori TaxID=1392758 RepID=A0A8J3QDC5_9ACTN|nr:FAD-dependent oxidoreductase [Rhizocola hellebori]GIH07281.1 amino acid oxidase [Rhizocola hellebori]
MGNSDQPVSVVGAGVSGMTTAVVLAEAGIEVEISSAMPPRQTTSAAAGACWSPYLVNHERATEWSEVTLAILAELANQDHTGVRIVGGIDASRVPTAAPNWTEKLNSFRLCHQNELPGGYLVGWWYEMPILDMPVYLDYLAARLARVGVEVQLRKIDSLHDLARDRIVINCTGVGARELCGDDLIMPARGQLVVVNNPGLTTFFQDCEEREEDLLYWLPQGDHVVLGGCTSRDSGSLEPDPEVAREIVKRCARIEPRLAEAKVIENRVGVRPSRKEVRLEEEGNIIHNYGHGGAGVTLSWGCAATVLELVKELGVAHRV